MIIKTRNFSKEKKPQGIFNKLKASCKKTLKDLKKLLVLQAMYLRLLPKNRAEKPSRIAKF